MEINKYKPLNGTVYELFPRTLQINTRSLQAPLATHFTLDQFGSNNAPSTRSLIQSVALCEYTRVVMLRYPCMLLSSGYYAEEDEARDRRKRSFMVDANTDHRRFRITLLCTNASRNCYRSTRGTDDKIIMLMIVGDGGVGHSRTSREQGNKWDHQ